MMRRLLFLVVVAACHHDEPTAPARADASASAPSVVSSSEAGPTTAPSSALPIPGWTHPAHPAAVPALGSATTKEAFFVAHGVTKAKPDSSCFRASEDECACVRAVPLPIDGGAIDALVCTRFFEGPPSSRVYMVTHTILYVADRGAPKVVLDVPTAATVETEDSEIGAVVGNVGLHLAITASGSVALEDDWITDAGGWCPEAVRRADAEKGEAWPAIRKSYREVCAGAGKYAFAGGRLLRVP